MGSGDRKLSPEAYRAIYEHSPNGVLLTAPDGRVFAANPAACEIFRLTEAEIRERGRQGLADPTDDRWAALLAERDGKVQITATARMIRGDGTVIEVEMSNRVFREADGELRTCTIIRDVTDRVRMERELLDLSERLHEMTLTDELTGIHNRRGFIAVGSHVLEVARRQELPAMVLYVDVDEMKEINDRFGHRAGDAALRAVARALAEHLRSADTVARIGGDEFVALTVQLTEDDCDNVERRLRRALSSARTRNAVGQAVDVSMGWARCLPREAKNVEALVDEADAAMYRAKSSSKTSEPD